MRAGLLRNFVHHANRKLGKIGKIVKGTNHKPASKEESFILSYFRNEYMHEYHLPQVHCQSDERQNGQRLYGNLHIGPIRNGLFFQYIGC